MRARDGRMKGIAICGALAHLATSGVHSVRLPLTRGLRPVYEAHQPIHISSIPSMRLSTHAGIELLGGRFRLLLDAQHHRQPAFEAERGWEKSTDFHYKLDAILGETMEIRRIETPLTEDETSALRSGDKVLLSGYVYTARDAAHKRFADALAAGVSLPLDVAGQVIYYCGPSPAGPGRIIGAAGPTTSSRMDAYTPALLALGLKGMIGKGRRSKDVKEAIVRHKAVYFGATGGAGALLSGNVLTYEIIAYPDLGPEAVARLYVRDLPLFVVNDSFGNDLYEMGESRYRMA